MIGILDDQLTSQEEKMEGIHKLHADFTNKLNELSQKETPQNNLKTSTSYEQIDKETINKITQDVLNQTNKQSSQHNNEAQEERL